MNKGIIKPNGVKLNSEGNQIIEEAFDGGGITQTIKYGLIKLMNEKNERRVSLKTIVDIENAQKANFTGKITIPELNMSVYISQVVMMRSETEKVRIDDNIANLPTETICLDLNLNITNHIPAWFRKNLTPYYDATVHYVERDGGRQYYLDFNKIQKAAKITFNIDGYEMVSEIYEYGVQKYPSDAK